MKDNIRKKLLSAGVANLKEFGYRNVSSENILTDKIYKEFFKSMLEQSKGMSNDADQSIDDLLKEIG